MMIMECHLLKQSKEEMILKKYFGVEFHKNKNLKKIGVIVQFKTKNLKLLCNLS